MIAHTCLPSTDPRRTDTCVKCGRPMPAPETDLTNAAWELEAVRVASRAAGVNGDALLAFATMRKHDGVVRNHATRNFFQEVVEELADTCNYCLWWLEQMDAQAIDDPEARQHVMMVLGAAAVAFEHARLARAHQR